jgi:hypothetical protein
MRTARTIRSATVVGPQIVALLMAGPITWIELKSKVRLGNASADAWLEAMRQAGILRVCGYAERDEGTAGKRARLFELQKPWAKPDEPYPLIEPRRPSREREAKRQTDAPPHSKPLSWSFDAPFPLQQAGGSSTQPSPPESPTA